jgi:hypothetical protein
MWAIVIYKSEYDDLKLQKHDSDKLKMIELPTTNKLLMPQRLEELTGRPINEICELCIGAQLEVVAAVCQHLFHQRCITVSL